MDTVLNFLQNGLLAWSGWKIFAYTLIVTHITIAGVTIYLHRCQAHRALELHPVISHFFRFWLWLTTGMVTGQWAAIHRKHHAKCETEEDPHSPQTRGIWKVFLEGAELYRTEAANKETFARYGHGTPNDWIERHLYGKHSVLGIVSMLTINLLLFGIIGMSVWAVQMMWIPLFAAGVINGFGHYWGYRNFDSSDASRNILPWGILIGGEELHNNHHTFATSAKLSNKWYEFDIGWFYIRTLSLFGLATVKKTAPVPKLSKNKIVCDLETLQAVLANRYDVMAQYAGTLKRAYRSELQNLKSYWQQHSQDPKVFANARKWFHKDEAALCSTQKAQLLQILEHSKVLQTYCEMRRELLAIWERSHSTTDQLLHQLQAWCQRAEQSGIHALKEFSLHLRRYV